MSTQRSFYFKENTPFSGAIKVFARLILALALTLLPLLSIPIAQASTITGAIYEGTINVSNNSTAASNVFTVATIDTSSLISAGYVDSDLANTSIQNDTGVDVAYMPAKSGSTTWSIYVPSIGTTTMPYNLYTGGADMSGKIRYFPGSGGMTIAHADALEPSDNFSFSLSGFFDTTASPACLITGDSTVAIFSGTSWPGQTFTPTSDTLVSSVGVRVYKESTGEDLTVHIRETTAGLPSGADKTSGTLAKATMTATSPGDWHSVPVTPYQLTAGQVYAVILSCDDSGGVRDLFWRRIGSSTYAGGSYVLSTNSGSTWTADTAKDFMFEINPKYIIQKPNALLVNVSAANTITATITGGATISGTASLGERDIIVSADTDNLTMAIDGTVTTITLGAVPVPDTTLGWTIGSDAATPYIEQYTETVAGVLQADISWENAATFSDASPGHLHPATPTFRTTSSDADVSASLSAFQPVNTAEITSFTLGTSTAFAIFSSNSTMPSQMYTENVSGFPMAELPNALLDASGTPRALWWYPFLFIGIAIIGLLTYEATTMVVDGSNQARNLRLQSGGKDGSMLAMCIVIEFCLVMIGLMGASSSNSVIPFFPAMLFLIPTLLIISMQWSVKT